MIPISLLPKNFLSYGDNLEPLDFREFQVACLTGNNGQGKSALLEAMIWAVWGEGRKSSYERKADSSLLRIGQEHMQVEFVFSLNNDTYKIIRSFSKKGKMTKATLEFHVFDGDLKKYHSLTAPSIRETQDKIIKTLRLDYETFINSAFILQGKSDEFSKKTARERKEILSDILGLSQYDDLGEMARSYVRNLSNNILSNQSRLDYINQETENLDFLKDKLQSLTSKHILMSKVAKEKDVMANELKADIQKLKYKEEKYNELEKSIEQKEQELEQKQIEITEKENEIKEYQELINQKEEILAKFTEHQKLTAEANELNNKYKQVRNLEEEKRPVERAIESKKINLTVQIKNTEEKIEGFTAQAGNIEKLSTACSDLQKGVEHIAKLEEEKKKLEKELNDNTLELNNISTKIQNLKQANIDNEEKITLLEKNPEGKCPLCEAKLNEERIVTIEEKLENEIDSNNKEIAKLKSRIAELEVPQEKLVNRLDIITTEIKSKDSLQQKLHAVKYVLGNAEQAVEEIKKLQEQLQKQRAILADNTYAVEEYKRLMEINDKIKAIDYEENRHSNISIEIEKLSDTPYQKMKLENAETRIKPLREAYHNLTADYSNKELEIKKVKYETKTIADELVSLPRLKYNLSKAEEELKTSLHDRDYVLEEKGRCQSQYEQCLKLSEESKEVTRTVKKLEHEKIVYEKLITAFSKNGIQALIIEDALPEIEEEANNLLARLTNNGTQIMIESLKDLKKGGMKETLDIRISDEMGIRDYEMYSGGEAFRIDFSIRIALSKLLARRAGTKLSTLIIDEGFGTQDEEGLENVIKCIQSIIDDFEKIIVITHLEKLKNAFPVMIEINKYPDTGSTYKIIRN
jgi:DNA repair protein SbcC/Rad50